MDKQELKPCPFCGEKPKVFTYKTGHSFAGCENPCGAHGPIRLTEQKAIEAWNKRV